MFTDESDDVRILKIGQHLGKSRETCFWLMGRPMGLQSSKSKVKVNKEH